MLRHENNKQNIKNKQTNRHKKEGDGRSKLVQQEVKKRADDWIANCRPSAKNSFDKSKKLGSNSILGKIGKQCNGEQRHTRIPGKNTRS